MKKSDLWLNPPEIDGVCATLNTTESKGQNNKLKGTAMEKIVSHVVGNNETSKSLKNVIKELQETNEIPNIYSSRSNFSINDKKYSKGTLFFETDLQEGIITGRETCKSKEEFLLRCSNKECKKSNQTILKFGRKKGKCIQCGDSLKYYFKKLDKVSVFFYGNFKDVLNYLIDNKHIVNKNKLLNRKLDSFSVEDNLIYVYECKNNEISGIQIKEIHVSLLYPLIIKKLNIMIEEKLTIIDELVIIYNGEIAEGVVDYIENMQELHGFKIFLKPLHSFTYNHLINGKFIVSCDVDLDENQNYIYKLKYLDDWIMPTINFVNVKEKDKSEMPIKKDDRIEIVNEFNEIEKEEIGVKSDGKRDS